MKDQSCTLDDLIQQQRDFCVLYDCDYLPTDPDSKLGFSFDTKDEMPINGLRHPPEGDTNGWYVWGGEVLPTNDDAFAPIHTKHLIDYRPEVIKFLGLPPGYRFLIVGDYVDVWFDSTMLET